MKTLKLIALLFIVSLQVNASGYAHNMFVAHKKLQTGKEVAKTKTVSRKVSTIKSEAKRGTIVKANESAVEHFATKVSGMMTLNERILEEGPASFFENQVEEKESGNSVVAKLVSLVKTVVYAFVAPSISRS